MSEIRDNANKKVGIIVHRVACAIMSQEDAVEAILSIPELAVVNREAELPSCNTCEGTGLWGGSGINDQCGDCNGTGKDYTGYVKEIKE